MRDSRCTEGAHYGCSCDDSELRDLRAAIMEWVETEDIYYWHELRGTNKLHHWTDYTDAMLKLEMLGRKFLDEAGKWHSRSGKEGEG